MAKDLIRYDLLTQEALRGVVRKVLADVAKTGLPGEHHFFIAFATDYPGVRLSQRLREQYPGEMTIILQHQFWDLATTDHALEVGLSFGGVPERLLVPFDAITQFFDPSANFGLKFEAVEDGAEPAVPPAAEPPRKGAPRAVEKPAPAAKPVPSVARMRPAKDNGSKPSAPSPEPVVIAAVEEPAGDDPATSPAQGAEVVSLDKFRKK